MSRKIEMIRDVLANGRQQDLYELLMGLSRFARKDRIRTNFDQPTLEITKLVGAAREHLFFVATYGSASSHVIDEHGGHHFAYPDHFSR